MAYIWGSIDLTNKLAQIPKYCVSWHIYGGLRRIFCSFLQNWITISCPKLSQFFLKAAVDIFKILHRFLAGKLALILTRRLILKRWKCWSFPYKFELNFLNLVIILMMFSLQFCHNKNQYIFTKRSVIFSSKIADYTV